MVPREENMEASSTPRACPNYHHRNMLGSNCGPGISALEEPARQRLDLRPNHQRTTLARHFPLPLLSYNYGCYLQYLLGMDRPGNETHGALLSIEQGQRSSRKRLSASALSLFIHSTRPTESLQTSVSHAQKSCNFLRALSLA